VRPGRPFACFRSLLLASSPKKIASSSKHHANLEQVYLIVAPESLTGLPSLQGTV
jgi:hypothetical protein